MKRDLLKKNIIINSSIFSVLILLLIGSIYLVFFQKKNSQDQTVKIKNETESIKSKTSTMASKAVQAKKYRDLYMQLAPDKKTNLTGIKMDEINLKLKTIGDKYQITAREIKINVPETLKDEPFKLKTMAVLFTTVTLNFRSFTEDKAFLFIEELLRSLNGFNILYNIDLRKDKEYSSEDLINISAGRGEGRVTVKTEFYWYSLKEDDKGKNTALKNKLSQIKAEKQEKKATEEQNQENQIKNPPEDKIDE